ncbi:MAG: chromate transporter [Treponema sp.]|nr:chromate transporter [Treponema sp.]
MFLYLFGNFFRIGFFAIGGGLATVPFLFELADNSDWLSREMIGNMLAVAQVVPGAIGVNLSAYTGLHYAWIPGGYIAVLGLIVPSIIIITIISRMLQSFRDNTTVNTLFMGFRPAAVGLLSAAGFGVISLALWNNAALQWYQFLRWKETIVFLAIFFLIFKFKKHPVVYIAIAAVVGVVLKL